MRALVLSDCHFGAWTGDDLLRRDWALESLEPHLDGVDEVVLLGDLFDFLFATVTDAFAAAEAFFDLLERRLEGKRLVWLAGNHDHHIVVRELENIVELSIATGKPADELEEELRQHDWFRQFLERRLPRVEAEIAYPNYRFGNAMLSHGHYLDAHVGGSIPNRLLTRTVWSLAGGRVSHATIADYEAVIVPLTELLFTEAQLPKGRATEKVVQDELHKVGRAVSVITAPEREVLNLARWVIRRVRRLIARLRHTGAGPPEAEAEIPFAGDEPTVNPLADAVSPSAPAAPAVKAYAEAVRNLGWAEETDIQVFAHTHQPLEGVRPADAEPGGLRFWNTGSWIYGPVPSSRDSYLSYLDNGWPGTAILLDTEAEEPRLIHTLEETRLRLRERVAATAPRDFTPLPRWEDVERSLV